MPRFSRSSPYPSDVALMVQAPIFHVNGDDPEAVTFAAKVATEYRQKFGKDAVLDVFCYRRYGHNEGDEPAFTQPLMYKRIKDQPTTREIYTNRLVEERVVTAAEVDGWIKDLDSNNLEVREAALRGLGCADDPRALPAVVRQCDASNDDATRMAAIGALARKGHFEAVKPLTALLKDKSAPILIAVARSLDTIQMPEAVPDLLAAAKKEKRDRVLGVMLRAAARSQGSNAEVRELCLRTFKSASAQLKGHVMVALGHLDTDKKIVDAMLPLIGNRNQNTRGLAAWVLGGQRTPESAKALAELQRTEKAQEMTKLVASAVKHNRGEVVEGYDSLFFQFLSDY